ncbi:hypothetical protein BDZ90DRAFT_260738 [Jaminaea rosea]|uniref:Uncharacterized protein n=1 Tax=Jaminaea rosea TaxID=1569628 RepID=A0A316UVC9_9BASI|nr:hypothetical protein BDZ90DRAFT_260738 [Jaminaea rosea]PWN27065.1 hypothetical protein BDZ90DRAFT_260738 [Jaminaea rosea]
MKLSLLSLAASLLLLAASSHASPLHFLLKRENALVAAVFGSVSDGCKRSLYSLAMDAEVESCLHLHDFAKTLYSVNRASESIIEPVEQFLSKQVCKKDACSADAINAAQANIADDCKDDLANNDGFNIAYVLQYVLSRYNPAREALCLQDSTHQNMTCSAQQLDLIQTTFNSNVSQSSLLKFFQTEETPLDTMLQSINATNETRSAFCNNCTYAFATTFLPYAGDDVLLNSTRLDALRSNISSICGESFLDGKMPASVMNGTAKSPSKVRAPVPSENGTVSATTPASNGALSYGRVAAATLSSVGLVPLLLAAAVATVL